VIYRFFTARLRHATIKQKLIMVMLFTSGVVLAMASLAFIGNELVTFQKNAKKKSDASGNHYRQEYDVCCGFQ
jgi:hypothetical protein